MVSAPHGNLRLAAGHRHYDHRLGPLLAIERGYFAAEGFGAVSVLATGEDDLTVEALRHDEIDLGLDVSPAKVIHAHATGFTLRIIGSMQNGVRQVLTSIPEITAVPQLRGRRIHIVEEGSGVDWHPLRILLRKHGLDPDRDVEAVHGAPFPAFANADIAFRAGVADARMMLSKEEPALRAAGYAILHDFATDYPAEYPQRVIVATPAFLDTDPARAEAFMRAMIRAYRFMARGENFDACMAVVDRHIIDANYGFPPGYPVGFHRGWGFKRPANGGMDPGGLRRFIEEETLENRVAPGLSPMNIGDPLVAARAAADVDRRFGPGGCE